MRRFVPLVCLPLIVFALGCSNRPLAGLMDCFFPSRGTRPPSDLPRPTDSDPLPPPVFDPRPPTDDGFRRDGLPRIGDPVGPDGRRPSESDVPFSREPGAMPLPGGR